MEMSVIHEISGKFVVHRHRKSLVKLLLKHKL
jgi:hypothetical protein